MLENILIGVFALMVLSAVFMVGYFFGLSNALDVIEEHIDDDDLDYEDLHCFQCEMEMSVKEVNGRLHCNNCGLRH